MVQTQNAFEALFDDQAVAAHLSARADLMLAIRRRVEEWGLPQEEAAARLLISRPRLSDLLRGKIEKFSIDALVKIADSAGYSVEVRLADRRAA